MLDPTHRKIQKLFRLFGKINELFIVAKDAHFVQDTTQELLKSQLLQALWVSTRDSLYKNDDCLKMNTLLSLLVNTQYFIEYYFNIMEGKIVCSLLDNNARNGNRQRSSTCSLDSFRSNNESTTFTRGFLPLVWSLYLQDILPM